MVQTVVEMQHITKKFGNLIANNDVSLKVHQGEILALLGENGAGKSTLMSILSGLLQPTSGKILINDRIVSIKDPQTAKALGIGMVHQHFMLIPAFSVLENIILGDEPHNYLGKIKYIQAKQIIKQMAQRYHLQLDLDAKVADISVGMQQRVEIMKALYRKADVLIFDEPTAALTPQEIKELMQTFRILASENKAIIFITHKIKEIKEVADYCTIIRSGKVIETVKVSQAGEEQLAEMMVGRKLQNNVQKQPVKQQKLILNVKQLTVQNNGRSKILNLNLQVHQGEIVGLAGVDGNGQEELLAALTGMNKVTSGSIQLNGQELANQSVRKFVESKVGYVPEDRQAEGLILSMSVAENLALKEYYHAPMNHRGILNYKYINSFAQNLVKNYGIRTQNVYETVASLSGGNQQKVIIAREIQNNPDLLIAANPTRGVDVGAIEYIHRKIIQERNQGKGILLVSFELDEILKLSDRVMVIHDGQIIGEVDPKTITAQKLGLMMAGKKIGSVQQEVTKSEL
ncbi:ABC transporter ATP-binding protein [Bombilactobacillus bombi]|uniref:ABC transporter ATP-binding protein n=1 Tax=Bombilactobacillus bombi TaxID=1303590 RepID=UPI0015E5A4FA|nr:ABC transporter ATP-binding protein [Bombilactobacillus bombi]MBA1434072.1 ABC transporter ATP-binding protein [Bombilactobacillus bombi]